MDQKSRLDFLERSNDAIFYEYYNNINALFKAYDEHLSCSTPFQLLHCASNKFVCASDAESLTEKENRRYTRFLP